MCQGDATVHGATVELKVSGKSYDATTLAPEDAWIEKLDHVTFKAEVARIGKELADQQGPADVAHLNKIICWSRLSTLIGLATMWYSINPISIFLLSLGTMTRWTIVAHHVCHGGFDKCSNGVYNRFKFGVGSLARRCTDWLDWMLVEAWNVEHNQLHHYCLGEIADPDLVENNLASLREDKAGAFFKYAKVVFFMVTWKFFYYAPNTFKVLSLHELRRNGKEATFPADAHPKYAGKPVPERWLDRPWTIAALVGNSANVFFRRSVFFSRVLGPFFVVRFLLLPGIAGLLFGQAAYTRSLVSLILAELLTNAHAFLNIVTNHAGSDLYRFEKHCTPRSSTFYLRAIISSANFWTGSDLNDFMHGWLNYQVEHHMWPDLSPLSYQKAQPLVKALCKQHGVPYVQHSVFWRLKETVDIMVGNSSMRKFPANFENQADLVEN
eukprot:CAMPEP_0183350870 /NCGR_PEP_ID=MMETSP0164_2-20130417/21535_1 /TAXON_ID=221442 /ORGANISM="Coccolithus pelagicus ssp braarudi, Strain PLY182g" /LENGTH=438 /DNA_ID=CAMNT_0025522887 /DNA_START=67 /DNA_END=1383 /DNA_ORIENTATION=-